MSKWLDKYVDGGTMQEYQPNFNKESVSVPEGFVGMGNDIKGRNYSPAWGGQFAMGGNVPGAVGFTYARTGNIPSNGKYTKKTKASAENGKEMKFWQEGLDWKPKMISENGGWLEKYPDGVNIPKTEEAQRAIDAGSRQTYMSPQRDVTQEAGDLESDLRSDENIYNRFSDLGTDLLTVPTQFRTPTEEEYQSGRGSWSDRAPLIEQGITYGLGNELLGAGIIKGAQYLGKGLEASSQLVRENLKKGVTPLGYTWDALKDIPANIRRVNRGQEKILPKYVQGAVEKDPDLKRITKEMLPLREDAYGTYLGTQQGGEHMIPTGIDPATGMDRYKLLSRKHSPAEAKALSSDLTGKIKGMKSQGPVFAVDSQFGVMGGHSQFISPDKKSIMYTDKWDLQPFKSKNIPIIKNFEISSVIPGAKPFLSEGKIADIKTKYFQQTPYKSMKEALHDAYNNNPKWEIAGELNDVEYYQLSKEIEKDAVKHVKQMKAEGWNPMGYQPSYGQSFEYADINPYINVKSKFADGGPLNPKDFTLGLINSPKYKERLGQQGYANPAASAKIRSDAVARTNVYYQDTAPNPEQEKLLKASKTPYSTVGSRYNGRNIVMDKQQLKEMGSSDEAIQAHEFSHPETQDITQRGYEVSGLNTNERGQLTKRLKPFYQNPKVGSAEGAHNYDPTENKADMNALRFQLQKKGIDVFNKDVNMQDLQDLKNSDDFSTKRLFEHYEDKDLLYLLNNVADIQKANPNKGMAKNGSQLTKLDQLTNFTNYNKPTTAGGWLNKYK